MAGLFFKSSEVRTINSAIIHTGVIFFCEVVIIYVLAEIYYIFIVSFVWML